MTSLLINIATVEAVCLWLYCSKIKKRKLEIVVTTIVQPLSFLNQLTVSNDPK